MSLEGDQHVKMKAEIRMLFLQAEEHQRLPGKPPEQGRCKRWVPLTACRRKQPPWHFILNFQSQDCEAAFPLILWIFVIAAWANLYKVNKTSIQTNLSIQDVKQGCTLWRKIIQGVTKALGRGRGNSFIDGGQKASLMGDSGLGTQGKKRSEPCGYPQEEYQVTRKRESSRDPKLCTEAQAQILGGILTPSTSSPTWVFLPCVQNISNVSSSPDITCSRSHSSFAWIITQTSSFVFWLPFLHTHIDSLLSHSNQSNPV